ncbi:hypothetical protein ABBQ32_000558 [Trebouxia sp. C0010 RCD-2024]
MTQADLLQQGKLELVLDLKGDLLEGPVWDDRIKRLHFVDINGQLIHTLDPDTKSQHPRHTEVKVPEPIGNIGLTEDPNILLAALKRAIVLFDLAKQAVVREIATTPEEHGVEGYRFNDGKISPGGVFIGGRMHKSGAEVTGKHSHWYRLDWQREGGKSRLLPLLGPHGVQLPNGLDWNDKKGVMYFNDSINNDNDPPSGTIWEFKTDKLGIPIDTHPDGPHARKVKTLGVNTEGGVPDGMCLDHEGRIWTALCGGSAVVCIDPQSGDELHRIKLPVSTPTACAFAGTDLSVLYITTLDDKSESKGTGGLWSYELPGLSGWSASYVAKPL